MIALYFLGCLLRPICLPVPETLLVLWGSRQVSQPLALAVGVAGSAAGIAGMDLISSKVSEWIVKRLNCRKALEGFQDYIAYYKTKMIAVLFIIPVFPDIIISIGAAVSKISLPVFVFIAIMAKSVSIGMIVYSGEIAHFLCLEKWQVILTELFLVNIISSVFKIYNRGRERYADAG